MVQRTGDTIHTHEIKQTKTLYIPLILNQFMRKTFLIFSTNSMPIFIYYNVKEQEIIMNQIKSLYGWRCACGVYR